MKTSLDHLLGYGDTVGDRDATLQGWLDDDRLILDDDVVRACRQAGIDDWLFDACYQAVGDLAETIAHVGGDADMKNRGNDHLVGLKAVLGAKADGTVPTLSSRWLKALSGVSFTCRAVAARVTAAPTTTPRAKSGPLRSPRLAVLDVTEDGRD